MLGRCRQEVVVCNDSSMLFVNVSRVRRFGPYEENGDRIRRAFGRVGDDCYQLVNLRVLASFLYHLLQSFLQRARGERRGRNRVSFGFFFDFLRLRLHNECLLAMGNFRSICCKVRGFVLCVRDCVFFLHTGVRGEEH